MKKLLMCFPANLILLLTLSSWMSAQDPGRENHELAEPDNRPSFEQQRESNEERRGLPGRGDRRRREPRPGGNFGFQSFEKFSDGKIVKGAPYSATAITETVQTLSDGTKISHKRMENIYRDGEGRTRREFNLDRVGPFSVEGEPSQMVFIDDVTGGMRFALDLNRRTVRKLPRFGGPPPPFRPPSTSLATEKKTESLGKQTIEGIEAEGTRITVTIPGGKIGNDRPIEIVSERWESPELQVVVLSKHQDPRAGETTYRLTTINRSEPARSLFEIPSDFTVDEGPPMRPRRRRHEE
jgi:hypothetical protein